MTLPNLNLISQDIVNAAHKAGKEILELWKKSIEIEYKNDKSPVTKADREAGKIINTILHKITPNIPTISEEDTSNHSQKAHKIFWLIDPLDGTKEFIKGSNQFTVNIALIDNQKPILGVVYAPAIGETYFNTSSTEAYLMKNSDQPALISSKKNLANNLIKVAVTSNSHINEKTRNYLKQNNYNKIINLGSSLKFCIVAKGEADIYPRFGRTMEWDTAAGHAIVNAAGGKILGFDNQNLIYGKKNYENQGFICSSN